MSALPLSMPSRLPRVAPAGDAADAERYRVLRRILLRAAPTRSASGATTYTLELETPDAIDYEELDRILDACAEDDDGMRTAFSRGGLGANRLGAGPVIVVPKPRMKLLRVMEIPAVRAPRAPRAPRSAQAELPPIVCRCGAVRPRTRGTRPKDWNCGTCPT